MARGNRTKLAERWRALLNVNAVTGEFNASSKNVVSDFENAGEANLVFCLLISLD